MSTTNPTPLQIAAIGAENASLMYQSLNNAAIAQYNKNVAFYTSIYGTQPNASAPPKPTPPMLYVFSQAMYIQLTEDLIANPTVPVDWTTVLTMIQYIPIAPAPPTPTTPIYTIGTLSSIPGFYQVSVNTNNHSDLADGTVITPLNNSNPEDLHTYLIHDLGFGGMEALAQMTS